jgi:hypothetical protein
MAYQSIGLGTNPGDGTGDDIRAGGDKINDNFIEIYTLLGTGTALTSGMSATATVVTLAGPSITGVAAFGDGSAAAPSITNTGDTNTGIYFSAADTVAVSTGGTGRIQIDSNGIHPLSADGASLGVATLEFSDLYLADESVINFGNDQDITLTHAQDTSLAISGAGSTTGLIIDNTATDGDPFLQFALSGSGVFTMGIDDGDSDKFKIGTTAVGASTALTLTSAGHLTITDDLVIKDGGTIGSATTIDAITVASDGIVTFVDDIKIKDGGTIGSATTIDAITVASDGIVTFKDDLVIKDGGTIGSATTVGAISIASGGLVNLATASATVNGAVIATAGTQTIWIPAAAMRPTSSNGCDAITDVETTSGRPDLQVLDFDTSSDEHAQFQIAFPKSWDEGTITYRVFWTSTASDTDGVAWGLQGVSVANDGTIDVAYGTGVVVTDDNISAAEDCLVTSTSSAVTIASAAADTMTFFRIYRDVSDANDDMTEDARLIGVQIFFTTDAANDA